MSLPSEVHTCYPCTSRAHAEVLPNLRALLCSRLFDMHTLNLTSAPTLPGDSHQECGHAGAKVVQRLEKVTVPLNCSSTARLH